VVKADAGCIFQAKRSPLRVISGNGSDLAGCPLCTKNRSSSSRWLQLATRLRKYLEILDRNPVKKTVDILLQFGGGRRDRLRRLQHRVRVASCLAYRFDNMIEH
jgi:hypothetical protein